MHVVNIAPDVVFQALADPTRIRVLRIMAVTREETCLCELVDSLLEPQYKLSRHIKLLRQVGLLTAQRDGRFVYHRLVAGPQYLTRLYAMVRELPDPDRIFAADLRRFEERMRLRDRGRCHIGIQAPALAFSPRPDRSKTRA